MGSRLLPHWKIALRPLLAACGLMISLAGCDGHESGNAQTPDRETASEIEDPILADAPWFKLPEDWDEQHPVISPNAKPEAHFISLAEKEIALIPADGEGVARLEAIRGIDSESTPISWRRRDADSRPPTLPASSSHRIEISFEVGPQGIDEGGVLFVMPEPFWSWSEAQVMRPTSPGYTTATARGPGVELTPGSRGAEFIVEGRRLEPGEMIDIVVGAGPAGTRVDEFAEHGSEILIAVDADGDDTRRWIDEPPRFDIGPRPGIQFVAFGPAEVAPGGEIEISVSMLDANANHARWPDATIDASGRSRVDFSIEEIEAAALGNLDLAKTFTSFAGPLEPHRIRLPSPKLEGTLRFSIRADDLLEGLVTDVNPIVVRDSPRRLVWGDVHGHSRYSDGSGTPEDYFSYARDVARLDVVALTDHDHWGVRPLDDHPELADEILATALRFHAPGRFVTLPGYEWTNWLHGHRHVLYFDEEAPIFSAIDPATDRPDELWDALRGKPALTFAHHSAGEPVATNWFYRPDPELEPLTEISSVHGMSESADAPLPIGGGIRGNFVRDILQKGVRLGFIGSGDSHDGHPGLAHLVTGQSGLAGLFVDALDRPSLHLAMKERRTFATNGIRPWLEVFIDETMMGGALPGTAEIHRLRVRYEATKPIERIDLVRSGRVASIDAEGALSVDLEREIPRLRPGDFHYVRIVERNGGVAWSSPIFVDAIVSTKE